MDNTFENKTHEKDFLETNIAKLSKPIADFIRDFETWPKEEQDKIETFNNDNSRGYAIDGKPAASHKYNGCIGYYLDCRLDENQIAPFLATINYLKKQQNETKQQ